ncbi:pyroglutamyl-peptidase 1-like [Oryzias latipes]|uniref:Pyroglutamyl-peptidase I like n=1 Tax=Oryzias latipes TaxID=8090 RepID=A0A3B3H7J1_ORYLA|nr:pyroglutamyl-peptidase 1-like [Oryzias latipes]
MNDRDTVVVTGFGPFKEFLVNPSWKAAQALKEAGLGEKFEVHSMEVPVSYVKTQQIITELWQSLKPKFAVHLGIARGSRVLLLEQSGRNRGFKDRDVCGFCPQSCMEGGPEKLHSIINMRAVSKHIKDTEMDVLPSADAGRFLCDFAYYCSLHHGHQRAAFIHIPSSGCLASADRLVPVLRPSSSPCSNNWRTARSKTTSAA